jgi:hypothetical protein
MFMGPRNWFQGMNSTSLCSLAGRYDNPIPPRFLVPIDFLKIPALVFSWISFPPAPEYSIKTVSIFFENSRRYSQIKVHHRYQRHRWQIFPPVSNSKQLYWYNQGLGGNWLMKKTRSKKSRNTVRCKFSFKHRVSFWNGGLQWIHCWNRRHYNYCTSPYTGWSDEIRTNFKLQ